MPRIPAASLSTVQTPLLQGGQVDPARSYAGPQAEQLGQAMIQAGGGIGRLADAEQHQFDLASGKRLMNQAMARQAAIIRDYESKTGKTAVDAYEPTVKALRDAHRAVMGDLGTSGISADAKDVTGLVLEHDRDQTLDMVERHHAHQLRTWNAGESKAAADLSTKEAIATFEPGMVGRSIAPSEPYVVNFTRAEAQIAEYAEALGYPQGSEQRKALLLDRRTQIHVGIVERMLAEQRPDIAREYLAQAKGEMDPAKLPDLQRQVQQGTVADESLRLARTVIGKGTGNPATMVQEAEAELGPRFDKRTISAEVYRHAMGLVEEQAQQGRRKQADQQVDALRQAQTWLVQNPGKGVASLQVDQPALYAQIDRLGLQQHVRDFADRGRRTTDPKALYEVLRLQETGQLTQLLPSELFVRYSGRLDASDFAAAQAMHAHALGSASEDHLKIVSLEEQVAVGASKLGITKQKDEAGGGEAFFNYRKALQDRVRAAFGNKATPEQVQQIQDEIAMDRAYTEENGPLYYRDLKAVETMTPAELKSAFVYVDAAHGGQRPPATDLLAQLGITAPAYVVPGREQVYLRQIPAEVRNQIVQALQEQRLPVTTQAIANMWVQHGRPGKAFTTQGK